MSLNARSKGASGEREFCQWLCANFNLDELPERNLEQVRNGGTDIILPPFGFEVKRRESLDFDSWWIQVKNDCERYPGKLIPVVAFRENHKEWEFLISGNNIGVEMGHIHINKKVFLKWSERYRK